MNSANLQYLKLWNTGMVSSNIFLLFPTVHVFQIKSLQSVRSTQLVLKTERNIFEQGNHQTFPYSTHFGERSLELPNSISYES